MLLRLAVSKGSVSGLYLGATISGTADFGNWSDGSEENYENFAPGKELALSDLKISFTICRLSKSRIWRVPRNGHFNVRRAMG